MLQLDTAQMIYNNFTYKVYVKKEEKKLKHKNKNIFISKKFLEEENGLPIVTAYKVS